MLFVDLDGTLLDVRQRHYSTYVELLDMQDMRGQAMNEKQYWGLRREGKTWEEILRLSRLFPTKFKTYEERFRDRVETPEMLAFDVARPGTVTSLSKLFTKTPIVLVTQRRDGETLESQLAQLQIRKYFVTVLSGAPPRGRRKDPDARWKHKAELIRNRYRLLPEKSVYLGDTETDVKAARSLGFEVFLFEGGHRTKELQMKADPDRIVADLTAALRYLLPGGRWQR